MREREIDHPDLTPVSRRKPMAANGLWGRLTSGEVRPRGTDPAPTASPRRWRLGDLEVDADVGELRRRGLRVPLQDLPLRLLLVLLERPGEVVSRETLHEHLWPGERWGDLDHRLNNAVARLRRALGDHADAPRWVETVPRRGLRFVGRVEPVVEHGPAAARPAPRHRPGVRPAVLVLAGLGAVLVALFAPRDTTMQDGVRAAHALLAEGRTALASRTPVGIASSVDLLERAADLAPEDAEIWAELARAALFRGAYGLDTPENTFDRASSAARRALEIAPRSAAGLATLAEALYRFGPNAGASDPAVDDGFRRALGYDDASATAHHWFGAYLTETGRAAEAVPHLTAARRLDPLDLNAGTDLVVALYDAGHPAAAERLLDEILAASPAYPKAHYIRGFMRQEAGRHHDAVVAFREASRLAIDVPKFIAALGEAHALDGDAESARAALTDLRALAERRYVRPSWIDGLDARIEAMGTARGDDTVG